MIQEFMQEHQSIILATEAKGIPHASYAPYVMKENRFYIYISDMAQHGQNIKDNHHVGLLFIEPEATCKNIFARKRVSVRCDAQLVARGSEPFEAIMEDFAKRYNDGLVERLKGFTDFYLYALVPVSADAVFGFGEAYQLDPKDFSVLAQKGGSGHQK